MQVTIEQMYAGSGTEYTLTHSANKTDTLDMTRKGTLKVLKTGLVRYVIHTPLAEYLSVVYNNPTVAAKVVDNWDCWFFSDNFSSWLNGESEYKCTSLNGRFTAPRVTEDWKFRFSNKYDFPVDDTTTIASRSTTRTYNFNGFAAKNLSIIGQRVFSRICILRHTTIPTFHLRSSLGLSTMYFPIRSRLADSFASGIRSA